MNQSKQSVQQGHCLSLLTEIVFVSLNDIATPGFRIGKGFPHEWSSCLTQYLALKSWTAYPIIFNKSQPKAWIISGDFTVAVSQMCLKCHPIPNGPYMGNIVPFGTWPILHVKSCSFLICLVRPLTQESVSCGWNYLSFCFVFMSEICSVQGWMLFEKEFVCPSMFYDECF